MKKIINKFWGVALIVMMLSSLFLVATPAAAGNYAFSDAAPPFSNLPTMSAGLGFVSVAQSGDTVYALGLNTVSGLNSFYKSADGGATWATLGLGIGLPPVGTWKLVATAYDDPTFVAVVNAAAPDVVYLSNNGGITFSALSATGMVINSIDISPVDSVTAAHFIVIGGNAAGAAVIWTWQTGTLAPAWTLPGGALGGFVMPGAATDIQAVRYSPGFGIDQGLLFVTKEPGAPNDTMQLHMYSYGFALVDPLGSNFPRAVYTAPGAGIVTSLNAVIVLDDNFVLDSNETGFVGAEINDSIAGEVGGTFRIDTSIPALTRIQGSATGGATGLGINSVAWDGANLITAPYPPAAITIYRSANALTALASFLGSSPYKTPGTGTLPIVFFAGGNAFCVSQGRSACVAKSTDLGKSFDGVALFNNSMATVSDFWIKSDGSVIYAVTDEGVGNDVILWKQTGAVWKRVLILAGQGNAAPAWIVRSAQSDTNAVYLGRVGFKTIYKSLDGGEFVWTPRSCTQVIADFAVQSATVLYVAGATAVVKTINGTTSWSTVGTLTGFAACYSITLLADNKFVVGGLTGFVGYYDGTAWTAITVPLVGASPTVVTASGTATGDVLMAANGLGIGTWTIGTNTALTGWTADNTRIGQGIAYANGILYVSADAANAVYRYIYPTILGVAAPFAPPDVIPTGAIAIAAGAATVNTLQYATGSNTLWVRVTDAVLTTDALYSWTEYLVSATPTCSYPVSGQIIPVNSLNGTTNPFNLQWTAPAVIAPLAGWTYTVSIFYNAAGTIGVPPAAPGTNVTVFTNISSNIWGAGANSPFTAGVTYYWRVQITGPITSFFSPMQSFTVQQLEAVVPVIHTPVNGVVLDTLSPGFSWAPISGVTSYQFQLSKEPSFVVLVYTDNTTTAGESLPVALKLVAGTQYFWRVRAAAPAVGDWSEVGNFSIAVPTPTPSATPPVTPPTVTATATVLTTPTVTVILPTTTQATVEKISPAYIWAIIIIGAVLVIAVIVLIVRTRRTV